ncbi:8-oxo-dGTP diphosphatase [Lederbergia galactosidilyticus]|uniref:NUDIX hydrolase n=1 Tax=Lederbergia galactosidilytica TaxID=217031 RepID=UPI001AE956B5|nr:NUDIX hydrolase [Lederbergia galactosidilytica]MBP1915038.1 8-oxo-dGTP diphosphatase [Lederbergia galactosidilytica]
MTYASPKQTIAVSAYVTNEMGEVLLVRTHWRSETWEMPGGNVEVAEPLDEAVCREVQEETGVTIRPIGVTGLYFNQTKATLGVVFRGEYVGGEITPQPEEIIEVRYIAISEENIDQYITRPQQRSRTLDAIRATNFVPYETWEMKPNYQLKTRLAVKERK